MGEYKEFTFKVPGGLPKEVYQGIQELGKRLGVSQRQIVVVALQDLLAALAPDFENQCDPEVQAMLVARLQGQVTFIPPKAPRAGESDPWTADGGRTWYITDPKTGLGIKVNAPR